MDDDPRDDEAREPDADHLVAAVGDAPEANAGEHVSPLGDLDDESVDASPEMAIAESLRTALGAMRSESDRIAELGTGVEQVEAAEQFAEDAGRLDEQVGSAARRADDDDRG
ncbi:MAG: hypothetical protein JWM86_2583 [Thermoleophilia bacterium]|nr:hypothetical protein [Thermoleophilia bacterium]